MTAEPILARFEYSLSAWCTYTERYLLVTGFMSKVLSGVRLREDCNFNNDLAVRLTYNIIRYNYFVMVYFCAAGGGVGGRVGRFCQVCSISKVRHPNRLTDNPL